MKLYLDGYYLEGTPEECLEFEMLRQGGGQRECEEETVKKEHVPKNPFDALNVENVE